MRSAPLALGALLTLGLAGSACGGSGANESAKSPESASAAEADLTPMQQLQVIPTSLRAQVADLTKPIDDVQKVIDQLASFPQRYNLNLGAVMGMAKATFDGGEVQITLSADVAADAKAELEAALNTLKGAVAALKDTPARVATLTSNVVGVAAKVPVLVTKVSASASATSANPFAGAEAKAQAQADLAAGNKVADDVMKLVSETQAKIAGVPAMATGALAKLTASFASADGAK